MEKENLYKNPVSLKNILKFAVPTIAMTVFMSFYTMVDGLFVSNLIGTNALSAINLTAPIIQFVTAISTMLATGGSAVIMKKMGEEKAQEAKEDFTFLILVNVLVGFVMCSIGFVTMKYIFVGMNLSGDVTKYCMEYLNRYLLFIIPILLMNNFTLYMIASGKAALSFICSVAGGILNIVFDYLFISKFHMGISGAAIATGLGYSVTAVVGLIVFSQKKNLLHFKKPIARLKVLGQTAANGCSEMATALVTVIFSFFLTRPLVSVFARQGNPVYDLAVTGNRICTIALFFIGFNIFASGMFTALSNGIISAVLAFSRSFVFMLFTMIILPMVFGVNGIWLATPVAELMALALSAVMYTKYKKRYGY